jgi:cyclopropane fatty-acyl-phospholipid synthase-like methyltransferase
VKQLYENGTYAELNPTYHEPDAPWKAQHIAAAIRRNNLPCHSICEVGCGTGEIVLNLSKAFPGSTFSGYEISKHAYERAKLKETSNVRYKFGDILATANDVAPFDVLILADVIEHVEDYISFVKQIKERAKYKIFHVPLDLSVQSLLRSTPITGQRASVGHIHYFYKETALATLRDCGYTIIDHHYTASRLELPNQTFSSRLMRLPRSLAFSIDQDLAVRVLGGYSLLVVAQ